ncbi:MAG: type I-C CRISPR-associated protein Cas5c [Clostridia bacterium]|nr:type I-C CRISPR-associated protein Cas5c [Clostridia bacterium]
MYGIKLLIKGDYACFTRPEMKVERVSYDVPTPSAMRGVIESIYWKPQIKWSIDKIHVLNPIKYSNIRRNEMKEKLLLGKVKQQMTNPDIDISLYRGGDNINQRGALILVDVAYGVEAHFDVIDGEDAEKHYAIATRRMKNGQYVKVPVLGCREFSAQFEYVEEIPKSPLIGEVDLGFMLYDLKFSPADKEGNWSNKGEPIWYRPKMVNGIIDVAEYFEKTGVNK